jgi:hypothetical protein
MKEQILERAVRHGIKMPDGRRWTWCGHEWVTNKRGIPVRVELWSSACRWCGAEFQIKQKLLWGKPAYNFQTQNCPEHRGQRARAKLTTLPKDGSNLGR